MISCKSSILRSERLNWYCSETIARLNEDARFSTLFPVLGFGQAAHVMIHSLCVAHDYSKAIEQCKGYGGSKETRQSIFNYMPLFYVNCIIHQSRTGESMIPPITIMAAIALLKNSCFIVRDGPLHEFTGYIKKLRQFPHLGDSMANRLHELTMGDEFGKGPFIRTAFCLYADIMF